ncbi:cytochrome c biogenesis protein ResA [Gordonia polyisoprenivorans NBRC 16320 = JCM 10675]|uniref:TlpA family protein disulfide reductase n=1 Tax=Gordonia polyisoprenivorans TaxID=84595 RepID=A0A846WHF1_9ACTN|nr:TlpA disulfide reductase family protein [Gordonia polyisoprenivorans]NKY00330.1 TlpA family protein disulfide reductase [Gordonia polyisoprenivorans]WCB38529.1 TlpA disulfide reductase family protein [Gordonia polyisoprenivorans]GAB25944.1 cytochrome c biogenesis protein ResA [Gordonia polyisoprenivorans NBRC 16320 = JCM 10675]
MRIIAALLVSLALGVALTACGTGDDAVSQGDTFQFVSPGGQTVITYDQADRKHIADVSGENLTTGKPLSLSDPEFADKAVVINVWGSWCGPCRGEAAALEQVYEQYQGQGVNFLGINLRDNRQSAQDFVDDRHVGYPSIYDFAGASLAALTTPTSVVPTTIVLDRQHRPAAVFLRAVSADELGAMVGKVIAEDPAPGGSAASSTSTAPASSTPASAAPSSAEVPQ